MTHYSMQDAARELGTNYQNFYYAVRRAKTLPSPTRYVGNLLKPYYSAEDLEVLRRLINNNGDKQ